MNIPPHPTEDKDRYSKAMGSEVARVVVRKGEVIVPDIV